MGCVRTACRPHIITHSPKPTSTHRALSDALQLTHSQHAMLHVAYHLCQGTLCTRENGTTGLSSNTVPLAPKYYQWKVSLMSGRTFGRACTAFDCSSRRLPAPFWFSPTPIRRGIEISRDHVRRTAANQIA